MGSFRDHDDAGYSRDLQSSQALLGTKQTKQTKQTKTKITKHTPHTQQNKSARACVFCCCCCCVCVSLLSSLYYPRRARTTSHEDNKPRTDGTFSTAGPLGRREPQRPPGQAVASRLREAAYVGWAVTTERASERASQRCWPEREREQKKTGPHGVLVLLLLLLDTFDTGARFYCTERWEIKSRNKFTTKGVE